MCQTVDYSHNLLHLADCYIFRAVTSPRLLYLPAEKNFCGCRLGVVRIDAFHRLSKAHARTLRGKRLELLGAKRRALSDVTF